MGKREPISTRWPAPYTVSTVLPANPTQELTCGGFDSIGIEVEPATLSLDDEAQLVCLDGSAGTCSLAYGDALVLRTRGWSNSYVDWLKAPVSQAAIRSVAYIDEPSVGTAPSGTHPNQKWWKFDQDVPAGGPSTRLVLIYDAGSLEGKSLDVTRTNINYLRSNCTSWTFRQVKNEGEALVGLTRIPATVPLPAYAVWTVGASLGGIGIAQLRRRNAKQGAE